MEHGVIYTSRGHHLRYLNSISDITQVSIKDPAVMSSDGHKKGQFDVARKILVNALPVDSNDEAKSLLTNPS